MHVALDLHLSLHEQGIGLGLAGEQVHDVCLGDREGGVGSALLSFFNAAVAILEIDSPHGGISVAASKHIIPLLLENFELVDVTDLLHQLSTFLLEDGGELLEKLVNSTHDVINKDIHAGLLIW